MPWVEFVTILPAGWFRFSRQGPADESDRQQEKVERYQHQQQIVDLANRHANGLENFQGNLEESQHFKVQSAVLIFAA